MNNQTQQINEYLEMLKPESSHSDEQFLEAESFFVANAKQYGEATGLNAESFKFVGVSDQVLEAAGFEPIRVIRDVEDIPNHAGFSIRERRFISMAKVYAQEKGLGYQDFIDQGIPDRVVREAGFTPEDE